jgi:hypothetical protein
MSKIVTKGTKENRRPKTPKNEGKISVAELRALPCRNVGSGDIQIFGRQPLKACHLSGS